MVLHNNSTMQKWDNGQPASNTKAPALEKRSRFSQASGLISPEAVPAKSKIELGILKF